jgi:hypothetical protein
MRILVLSAALVLAARPAASQGALSNAKRVTQNAVAASNAQTEAMQKPDGQQPKTPAKTPAPSATQQAAAKTAAASGKSAPQAGTQLDIASADTAGPPPSIMREVFDYPRAGRRDPFVSLLTTDELRPTMSDLRLTSLLIDHSGGNSIAILRDVGSNTQYRVRVGSTLGRMRVTAIRGLTVLLTIDEFGTTRQDSLVLRDSTKVRRP